MASVTRPDLDLDDDVLDIIVRYPPLAADRHHINIKVENGVIFLSGHTSTAISRRYLVDRVAEIPGVVGVNTDQLYDDPTIVREVGQVLPLGVIANSRYGNVVLSGNEPPDADALIERVAQIPGVRRVIPAFIK